MLEFYSDQWVLHSFGLYTIFYSSVFCSSGGKCFFFAGSIHIILISLIELQC